MGQCVFARGELNDSSCAIGGNWVINEGVHDNPVLWVKLMRDPPRLRRERDLE